MQAIELTNDQEHFPHQYPMPWKYDTQCFNFQMPEKAMTLEEIKKEDLSTIISLVISEPISDFSWISQCENLKQLYVYHGENMEDLSFLKNMTSLKQIALYKTKIQSLSPVRDLLKKKEELYEQRKQPLYECLLAGLYIESTQLKEETLIRSRLLSSEFQIIRI